ncbi:MAG: YbaK/EbsC family protein [Gammaproteobacteria bacterium]|nr:YbaK/EbsC family protein [Gammaproteobacteria bacterium]
MSIARTLQDYMVQEGIHYEVVTHQRTNSSIETAEAAHVPGDEIAKAVILEDDDGYVMAVVPATHHIKLGSLSKQMHRELRLAVERDLSKLFNDCEAGAVPPLGMAYGMPTVVDDTLAKQPDIYFEAGDHERLIHLDGDEFRHLFATAEHGRFSSHIQ